MKGLNLFENFDFCLIFFEKTQVFKRSFCPRGSVNLYAGTIENRWASRMHKNWISKNLEMAQY